MTYPNGQGLYDLEPTDAELDDLLEVLDEVEAEEALPGGDWGLWDDQADLSNVYDYSGAFSALDAAGEAEAARLGEDLEDRLAVRPSFQTRWDRAMQRISSGTYTPPAYYRPAEPETACHAHRDAYGRCGARYHSPLCLETARQEASTGSARAVEAWRAQLLSNQATSPVDLAAPRAWTGTGQTCWARTAAPVSRLTWRR
jgi:hypothetical protein